MTAQDVLNTLSTEELLALRANTQNAAAKAAIDNALRAEDDG